MLVVGGLAVQADDQPIPTTTKDGLEGLVDDRLAPNVGPQQVTIKLNEGSRNRMLLRRMKSVVTNFDNFKKEFSVEL